MDRKEAKEQEKERKKKREREREREREADSEKKEEQNDCQIFHPTTRRARNVACRARWFSGTPKVLHLFMFIRG